MLRKSNKLRRALNRYAESRVHGFEKEYASATSAHIHDLTSTAPPGNEVAGTRGNKTGNSRATQSAITSTGDRFLHISARVAPQTTARATVVKPDFAEPLLHLGIPPVTTGATAQENGTSKHAGEHDPADSDRSRPASIPERKHDEHGGKPDDRSPACRSLDESDPAQRRLLQGCGNSTIQVGSPSSPLKNPSVALHDPSTRFLRCENLLYVKYSGVSAP